MTATFKSSAIIGSLANCHHFKIGETYQVLKTTEKSSLIDLSHLGKKSKWVFNQMIELAK